ncbi:MAG: hypothetical protein ACRCXZ_04320 [Patescibacteria group bacterium]
MKLYNFFIAKPNLPFETLTYSSESDLEFGQICLVTVKNNSYYAICASKSTLRTDQIKNLKSIEKSFSIFLSQRQIEFLYKVGFLTFNSLNNLLSFSIKPFESLIDSKKNPVYELAKANQTKTSSKIDYDISLSWTQTIHEVITTNSYNNTLIITPEKNIQTKIKEELLTYLQTNGIGQYVIQDLTSTGSKLQKSYLNLFDNNCKTINFSNKNELFTTLDYYDNIIIIDEGNPSYISETRVYFDTREVAYWASRIYNLDLVFISTLPSVRFAKNVTDKLHQLKEPVLTIKFLERNSKQMDFNNVIAELSDDSFIIGEEVED